MCLTAGITGFFIPSGIFMLTRTASMVLAFGLRIHFVSMSGHFTDDVTKHARKGNYGGSCEYRGIKH
jgi:hypothetical protein